MSHRSDIPHRLPGGRAGSAAALCAAVTLCLGDLWAGDILRGGAPAGDAARRSAAANQATAAAAAAARNSARDSLARTSNALNAVKAMQAAARAAAAGRNAGMNPNAPGTPLPNVPNGLAAGGLQVDPGVIGGTAVWRGANLPTQSQAAGRTLVNIKQTQQTALLSWQTFNVGRETTLNFDQSAGEASANKWIAFNKVNDPSNAPSQILGSIQAPGQVYVINRNGIIFGAGSQVNVATLVASSLPINDNLIDRGLLNNPDAQFLFTGIALPAGANGTPAFTPEPPNPAIGRYGDVIVQAGATITSPTNDAKVGGRVMLVGPNVRNAGTINTPDGQTIVAAGLQVGIDAHSSSDPSLRGLDVYVGAVSQAGQTRYAGTVTNSGLIEAPRGSIVLTGADVNQFGALASSTTVSLNGRIDLLAQYDAVTNTAYSATNSSSGPPFLFQKTGTVRLGSGSVTSVLPELDSIETVIGQNLALNSQVNAVGRAIHLQPDSRIHAPSGSVTFNAGEWRFIGGVTPTSQFVNSVGQVYFDRNSTVDVAGTVDVRVPLTQNILTLELRGSELANSPLQRDGALRGVPITVDIRNKGFYNGLAWVGTPLGDVTGFANLIQRTVAEFTTPGGSVTIKSGNSVVMQPGSMIDVSGGFINYQGAIVKTTRLLSNGRLFDIKDATPDRVYDAVYQGKMTVSSARWGVTETFAQPLALTGEHYEPDYIHGADGGSIDITAPAMALDGELLGRTVNGPRQRAERAGLSSLRLAFLAQDTSYLSYPTFSPTPPAVTFGEGSQAAANPFQLDANGDPLALRADRLSKVILSPDLLRKRGFGFLTVENPEGSITLPADQELRTEPGGGITLEGANVTLAGDVTSPGGTLSFKAYNISLDKINELDNTATPVLPDAFPGRGLLTVGPDSVLSVAGLIADDRVGSPVLVPLFTKGGSISLQGFNTAIAEGSVLDVSGGVQIGPRTRAVYGNAGSLTIAGGRDLRLPSVLGGSLALGGTMMGYSGATGGTLNLTAPAFVIGDGQSGGSKIVGIDPEFFSTGGFSSFSLSGIGLPGVGPENYVPGVSILPGTEIRPVAEGWLAIPHPPGPKQIELRRFTRPEGMRSPVNLAFNALGAVDPYTGLPIVRGDVLMGQGASIETDGLGSVSFKGDTVTVLGSVIAPGGKITLDGGDSFRTSAQLTYPLATVYVGSDAYLSTAGKAIIYTNARGLREGTILAGGSITLDGNVIAEGGAVLDVSGSTGVLDLPHSYLTVNSKQINGLKGRQFVPVRFDTNGGSITLKGAQMLYSDATLIGQPGGPSAIGGSLSISSGRFHAPGTAFTSAEENLIVTQSGLTLPNSPFPRGVGQPLRAADGTILPGLGRIAVDRFSGGGFDSLTLGGNVRFDGPVSINMAGQLRVATGGVIYADSAVNLTAPYVGLGQTFRPPAQESEQIVRFTQTDAAGITTPYNFAPTFGTGSLTVRADLIDIGDLSLQGIGNARLSAPGGDIRGNGTFQMAGNLVIEAGQVFPTTMAEFNLFAYDYDPGTGTRPGSITFLNGSSRDLPLSGGGTLSVYASNIMQAGTLRAPLGAINLGWDGTGTAPSNPIAGSSIGAPVTENLTLAAGSVTSVSAVDPRTGQGILIPYGISLDGKSWIDPAGNDITIAGLPTKAVRLSGGNVTTEAGSTIDIRGGGDLYAYRWVQGNGGTRDILASDTSFAVIPGFNFDYAPYAPFNTATSATNLGGELGYVNGALQVGDKITLGSSPGFPAGTYTLLPARYALMPGAFLVTPASATPQSGVPVGTFTMPDGSSLVSGFQFSGWDANRVGRTAIQRYEVLPASVMRQRAEYFDYYANTFLREAALARDLTPPRLPIDSGYLAFSALNSMSIQGEVLSAAPEGGRGSLIDISSPIDILINQSGTGGGPGTLTLSASKLSGFNAESLLIGGLRTFGSGSNAGTATVSVATSNITVDNAGSPLSGSDIILAANGVITLAPGSVVTGTGSAELDRIIIGDAAVAGSGDGALLRVAGSESAPVTRLGVGNSTAPKMDIGAEARLTGGSITVDSTYATSLDPTAVIAAPVTALNSGQISVRLNNPGSLNPTVGLVLSGQALETLQQTARDLSLLSYSTFDVYGSGAVGSRALASLAIRASAIRGFNTSGGTATFSAQNLLLENTTGRSVTALPVPPLNGRLEFDANQIVLGVNDLKVERFATVAMSADSRLLSTGEGTFSTAGALDITTPLITGAGASNHTIAANGAVRLLRPLSGGTPGATGGLGAALSIRGASMQVNTDIALPSGRLELLSTAGSLQVGNLGTARLSLAGTTRNFLDVTRFTNGGTVALSSNTGSVTVGSGAVVDVSGPAGGGNAGYLNVSAPNGSVTLDGTLLGSAAAGQRSGSFTMDAGSVAGGSLTSTDSILNTGQFNELRDYRVRSGNITIGGIANARTYRAAADNGSLTVSGTINASGETGGEIHLAARGNLTLQNGSRLDASGADFDSAGKGGSIVLEAGTSRNGAIDPLARLDLLTGSTIDLSVDSNTPGSQALGRFTGTLHLRAPQTAAFNGVQMNPIGSTITDASSILVEAFRLYDITGSGLLNNALRDSILVNSTAFLGAAGAPSATYTAILNNLTSLQPGLDLILAPGAEILNRTGNLTLGTSSSNTTNDWNLATFRFGPRSAPGVLTLRAAGNIVLNNAISDGFNGGSNLWLSPLLANNALLPDNAESWSYRFTAGADTASAGFRETLPLSSLADTAGFLQLGKNMGNALAIGGNNALTSSLIGNNYNVIRTGSGDIDVSAARSVQLLNPFASIYTAGTQVANPTAIFAPNDFIVPVLTGNLNSGNLGAPQQTYPAQYSLAGGNVNIQAGSNIERLTRNNSGTIDDSSRQLPTNWLYRRGFVGPDGNYGAVSIGSGFNVVNDPAATTSWWIDFSNFFQSVGALGGGNVSLIAGNDVKNVDAVIPTNARAAIGAPSATSLLELGGGDLVVRAGRDVNAGIYYVEKGVGSIEAAGQITTNASRSPSLGIIDNLNNPVAAQFDSNTWLPTTLFVGKSQFDVTAGGDVLLGPVTNPFLMPQGLNNRFWYKTYFSTFSADAGVNVSSLGGDVTMRNAVTTPEITGARNILEVWLERQQLLNGPTGAAFYQPWLRLAETNLQPFTSLLPLQAPTMRLSSLDGDVNLVGNMTLFPAPSGQLEVVAGGQINAFQPTGLSNVRLPGQSVQVWTSASVNVSDANPDSVPGITDPFAYFSIAGSSPNANNTTQLGFLESISSLFNESGSTTGVFGVSQTKQALHTPGLLHENDASPLRLYALGGNVSGLELFSPKSSRIYASNDITDVALYLQNNVEGDASFVTAGRDIVLYNQSSPLHSQSLSAGNFPGLGQDPLAGDIQIAGPGSIQVLAGRDLDLGSGSNNADGTGVGINSIGNARNPFLPFEGASLILGAGIGPSTSLLGSELDVQTFIDEYVTGGTGQEYLTELGVEGFESLDPEEQARVALEVFYLVLRDAGRNFNNASSPGFGNYDTGFAAIESLFGPATGEGDFITQSRDVRTKNGGNISIFTPGGGLTLSDTLDPNALVPPGVVTEYGGNVSIFTRDSVDIGVGRIFTLRGGNIMIWSSEGDIAAGSASKTVTTAPPTRVLIDPQSATVETDLAGLATGGGIGVLDTVAGVMPGNVDLIAPSGIIDAGDAGIRVTGNINLAATQVLNASNIAAGGSSSGAPSTPAVSTPNIGGITSAGNTAAATSSAATTAAASGRQETAPIEEEATPSIITVEVLGYGGGSAPEEDEEEKKRREKAGGENSPGAATPPN
jgi:filamentous hemagglutinin